TFWLEAGNDKFYRATLPGAALAGGEAEYYFELAYSDHLTTFVHGDDGGSTTTADEDVARATPFHTGATSPHAPDGAVATEVELAVAAEDDERFAGLGEKFDRLDQTGKVAHILPVDEPTAKGDTSYKVAPWALSSRGYGLHLDASEESWFDLASSRSDQVVVR